jgi:hypothetical protein
VCVSDREDPIDRHMTFVRKPELRSVSPFRAGFYPVSGLPNVLMGASEPQPFSPAGALPPECGRKLRREWGAGLLDKPAEQ